MKVTVNGVDKTAFMRLAAGATIGPMKVNELSTASLQFNEGYAPARGDTVLMYAQDNTTLIFGGLVRKRRATSIRHRGSPEMVMDVTVDDWWTYLDTATPTSRAYTTSKTLKQVLTDLITDCGLNTLGFTLDAGQANGPTFTAFSWNNTRASDAIRTLSTWCKAAGSNYVARVSPAQVLKMFVPGTDAAPYSVTDSTPHCEELSWSDPDTIEYDAILLWCGPAGPISYTNTWIQAGAATSWVADIPAQDGLTAGYVTVGGIFKTLSVYGDGLGMYEWDYTTHTLHTGTDGTPANGTVITLVYNAASPFMVTSGTGARVFVGSAPTALTLADGQRTADGLYAQLAQAPITWAFVSHDVGWLPGQGVSVTLTTPSVSTTMVIGPVTIRLVLANVWKFSFTASESIVYPPTSDEQWRALLNSGAPSTSSAIVSTIGGGGSGMTALPSGDIYVGNGSNVATAVPMTGDIGISNTGVTAIQSGVIVNGDINASAGIVDTKLATIATAGKVANSATTATVSIGGTTSANPGTIALRDGNSDIYTRAFFGGYGLFSTFLQSPVLYAASGDLQVSTTSGNLLLEPGGDNVIGPTGQYTLPNVGYTQNLGTISNKFLTLHAAELWVETLVAQQTLATIGGRVVVAPTNILTRDLLATDYTGTYPTQAATMWVKYNSFKLHVVGVEFGSKILMESNGKFEAFVVADTTTPTVSGSGDYGYTVYRNQDNTGTNDWYAGDACLDTGKTGDGFIDLYSLRGVNSTGYGPSIVGNVRTTGNYYDFEPRWAIGNLNTLYHYAADTYGAAFGVSSGTWVSIDATDGFRIMNNTTVKTKFDTSGNGFLTGSLEIGTAGNVHSGASAFGTGTGWWMDYNGGTPRFRIGNPSGDNVTWNGSALDITSGNLTIDGSTTGNVSIGVGPVSAARLNIASADNTVGTYGIIATNAAATAVSLVTYGDGRTFIGGPIYMSSIPFDATGAGTNAGMSANGPFGSGVQPVGWLNFYINGVSSWLPLYQ